MYVQNMQTNLGQFENVVSGDGTHHIHIKGDQILHLPKRTSFTYL